MKFPKIYLEQPAEIKMFDACKLNLAMGRLAREGKLKNEVTSDKPPIKPATGVQQTTLELSTAPPFDREF